MQTNQIVGCQECHHANKYLSNVMYDIVWCERASGRALHKKRHRPELSMACFGYNSFFPLVWVVSDGYDKKVGWSKKIETDKIETATHTYTYIHTFQRIAQFAILLIL